jgi:hypothetical protein
MELFDKYPTGAKMAQSFESSALTDKKALLDVAEKPEKMAAEEAILRLAEKREEYVEPRRIDRPVSGGGRCPGH